MEGIIVAENEATDPKKVILRVSPVPPDPIRHKDNPAPPVVEVEFTHMTQAQKEAVVPPFITPEGANGVSRWWEGTGDYRAQVQFSSQVAAESWLEEAILKLGVANITGLENV